MGKFTEKLAIEQKKVNRRGREKKKKEKRYVCNNLHLFDFWLPHVNWNCPELTANRAHEHCDRKFIGTCTLCASSLSLSLSLHTHSCIHNCFPKSFSLLRLCKNIETAIVSVFVRMKNFSLEVHILIGQIALTLRRFYIHMYWWIHTMPLTYLLFFLFKFDSRSHSNHTHTHTLSNCHRFHPWRVFIVDGQYINI